MSSSHEDFWAYGVESDDDLDLEWMSETDEHVVQSDGLRFLSGRECVMRQLLKLFDDKGPDGDIVVPPHLKDYHFEYLEAKEIKRPQKDDNKLQNLLDYCLNGANKENIAHDEKKNARGGDGERAGPHSRDGKKAPRDRKEGRRYGKKTRSRK